MTKEKYKVGKLGFFAIFILSFLMSDYYYAGLGRPFDYVAIVLLIFLLNGISFKLLINSFFLRAVPLFALAMLGLAVGFLSNNILLSFGITIGILVIYTISYSLARVENIVVIEDTVYTILSISMALLFYQFFYFYLFGGYIDYSGYFGSINSRGYNTSLEFFRPHGIFQEPNGYCTAMFSLLALCKFFQNRRKIIENLACLTMVISLSLWGIVGAILLLLVLNFSSVSKQVAVIFMLFCITLLLIDFSDLEELAETSITMDRIINFQDDASIEGRLGGLRNIDWGFNFLFGYGIDEVGFQDRYGANGFSFLLTSFGLVGSLLILFYFIWITKFSIYSLIFISYLLLTFPLFSYVYFWIWLGILVAICRNNLALDKPALLVKGI